MPMFASLTMLERLRRRILSPVRRFARHTQGTSDPYFRRRLWFAAVKAIQIDEFGGPEVLRHRDVPDPTPAHGELVIDVARAGINFADTHATRNDYLAEQQLPLIPGAEVSGRTAEPPSIRSRSPNGVRTLSKAIDPTTVRATAAAS